MHADLVSRKHPVLSVLSRCYRIELAHFWPSDYAFLKNKESVIVCALALKAPRAFNSEQALPHWVAFRATLKRKANQCDTPACTLSDSEYSYYSVRKTNHR